ncbi:hypothetical protein D9M68_647440 [compost metagenome]
MTSYFEFTPTITTDEMKAKTNDPAFKYILLCAKICGTNHYNMQKTVRVVSEQEYKEWVAKQGLYLTDDLRAEFKLPLLAKPAPAAADSLTKDTAAKTNQTALTN